MNSAETNYVLNKHSYSFHFDFENIQYILTNNTGHVYLQCTLKFVLLPCNLQGLLTGKCSKKKRVIVY